MNWGPLACCPEIKKVRSLQDPQRIKFLNNRGFISAPMLQKELVETEVRTMIGIPMAPEIHMAVPERRETFHGTNSL